MKRKDNFTDAVEALKPHRDQKPDKERQEVADSDGNIVTLGQNKPGQNTGSNKAKLHELSFDQLAETIKNAMNLAFDRIAQRWNAKK